MVHAVGEAEGGDGVGGGASTDHRNGVRLCEGLGHASSARREGRELVDAHWAVPEDGFGARYVIFEEGYGLGPDVQNEVIGGDSIGGDSLWRGGGAELLGYYDVDREGHGDVPLFPLGHDARHEVEALFFVDGAAYSLAAGLEEGGAHPATDKEDVQLFHEPLGCGDLVADLGAAEEDGEGSGGVFRGHAEIFQFTVKKEACYRRQVVGNTFSRGMGPVGCAEGIVDEYVGKVGEGGGEFGVVGFLTGVEAEVFEEEDVAGGKGLGLGSDTPLPITASAIWTGRPMRSERRRATGASLSLSSTLPLGPTHVGAEYKARAPVQEELEGGEGGPDAAIVEDCAGLGVEGDVEVDSDKDSLAVHVYLVDCFLGHSQGF